MPTGARRFGRGIVAALRRAARRSIREKQTEQRRGADRESRPGSVAEARGAAYPGDFTGRPYFVYEPHPDAVADPGEVVWTWVPYEEDHAQGKDRPVLVIGRDGEWLLALQLTSKDHDRDEEQERRAGRLWMDVGSGQWDREGRPSEVRLNRIIRVAPNRVRRAGATLDESRFNQVADAVRGLG